jgi:hypothetical protein
MYCNLSGFAVCIGPRSHLASQQSKQLQALTLGKSARERTLNRFLVLQGADTPRDISKTHLDLREPAQLRGGSVAAQPGRIGNVTSLVSKPLVQVDSPHDFPGETSMFRTYLVENSDNESDGFDDDNSDSDNGKSLHRFEQSSH